jgi:dephospho-CoA kinase
MVVIGVTGKICSGKNRYVDLFEERGFVVIDVDELGHRALEENRTAVVRHFGPTILRDGVIDRKVLASIVFADSSQLAALEGLNHPWMVERCKALIEEARSQGRVGVVVNAALLKRMGLDALCDRILFIKAPLLVRYRRCRRRQNLPFRAFWIRNQAQRNIRVRSFARGSRVTVLHNVASMAIIHRQVAMYCGTIGSDVSTGS